jgi:hypothetical protein
MATARLFPAKPKVPTWRATLGQTLHQKLSKSLGPVEFIARYPIFAVLRGAPFQTTFGLIFYNIIHFVHYVVRIISILMYWNGNNLKGRCCKHED